MLKVNFKEEYLFTKYKDSYIKTARSFKEKIIKNGFKDVDISEVYRRIVNYQISKYGNVLCSWGNRDELVLNNTKLIYMVLKQLGLYNQRDEYYDVGMIGLMKAANKFDPSKGTKFNTYASHIIRTTILYEIRKENQPKRQSNKNTISLDTVIHRGDTDVRLKDVLPSDFNVERYLIEQEKMEALNKAIVMLNDEEKTLLLKKYLGVSQKVIAKDLKITQATVSRRLKRIIKKLRIELERRL